MNYVENNSGSGYFTINKTIKTAVNPINTATVSIYVKSPGNNLYVDRYDCYSVTAVTPYTDQYILEFRVPLPTSGIGIYSYKIYLDNTTDLDTNGVNTLIGSGSFYKVRSGSMIGSPMSNDGYVGDGVTGKQIKFTQFSTVYLTASIPNLSWFSGPLTTTSVTVIVKGNGIEKRFSVDTASYTVGVGGVITVPSLQLWGDGLYTYTVIYQGSADQDVTGTNYYKLTSGMFRKFTSDSSEG